MNYEVTLFQPENKAPYYRFFVGFSFGSGFFPDWNPDPKRLLTVHKAGSKYQHDRLYLQPINSDKHLPLSPFTGKFFR